MKWASSQNIWLGEHEVERLASLQARAAGSPVK
jgi:hypothetical protein